MRTRLTLLLLTVAANAALLGVLTFRPDLAPAGARRFLPGPAAQPDKGSTPGNAPSRSSAALPNAASGATVWSQLNSDDLRTLIARLRAAGFPPHAIRAVLEARLDKIFNARLGELFVASGGDVNLPYWKPDPNIGVNNQKYWEQRNQLYRERSRQLRELMGSDYLASYGTPANALNRAYGDIPPAKLDLIQKINDDYAEMTSQVRAAMQGITLPEDQEKMALLEREKRADIKALLTPEEYADYEMRTSRTTASLRATLTVLDSSEAEFRTLYAVLQPFTERLYPPVGSSGAESAEQRRAAQKEANEAVRALLGDQRYAEYARASNAEFQQLNRLTQREGIPAEAAVRAFGLRDTVATESNRIVDDATLSNEAKRAALQQLAQATRAQITTILGPTAGPAYAQAANWLTNVETGRAVTFTDGTATYKRVPGAATPAPRF
jgi:hypothetical protein